MPIPLQPLITLPLYCHAYTYIDLSVRRNERNAKPPLKENKRIAVRIIKQGSLLRLRSGEEIGAR